MMKRDGFVYSLYLKNMRNLTLLTIVIVCLYIWDLRELRAGLIDYGDSNFRVLCFYTVIAVALVVMTVLFLVRPALHPTYRQLKQFGPDAMAVAAQIDAEYDRSGVHREKGNRKLLVLDSWMIRRTAFFVTVRRKSLK